MESTSGSHDAPAPDADTAVGPSSSSRSEVASPTPSRNTPFEKRTRRDSCTTWRKRGWSDRDNDTYEEEEADEDEVEDEEEDEGPDEEDEDVLVVTEESTLSAVFLSEKMSTARGSPSTCGPANTVADVRSRRSLNARSRAERSTRWK